MLLDMLLRNAQVIKGELALHFSKHFQLSWGEDVCGAIRQSLASRPTYK
jgi:hypothetical protein